MSPFDLHPGRRVRQARVPDHTARVGPLENKSFWITLTVPADAASGSRQIKIHLNDTDLTANLQIAPLVLQPRHDFPVTHWWRAEAIWDWYKTGMFEDERFWTITEAYLRDYADHGSDVNISGISLTYTDWVAPVESNWQKDSYECDRDAREAFPSLFRVPGRRQMFAERCLGAKGYVKR